MGTILLLTLAYPSFPLIDMISMDFSLMRFLVLISRIGSAIAINHGLRLPESMFAKVIFN